MKLKPQKPFIPVVSSQISPTHSDYRHAIFLSGLQRLAELAEMYQPKVSVSYIALSHLPIATFIELCNTVIPEEADTISCFILRQQLVAGKVNPKTGVTVRLPIKAQETSRIYASVYKKVLIGLLQKKLLQTDMEQLKVAFPREFVSSLRSL